MKKLTVLLAMSLLLAACGSTSAPEKTGQGKTAEDKKGDYASASITLSGDKVKSISLDETKGKKSKKELGAAYNMKGSSKIGKEWNEQVEFLEKYITRNGLDKVKLNDKGYPENDDVLAGCTINLTSMMDAAQTAKDDAK